MDKRKINIFTTISNMLLMLIMLYIYIGKNFIINDIYTNLKENTIIDILFNIVGIITIIIILILIIANIITIVKNKKNKKIFILYLISMILILIFLAVKIFLQNDVINLALITINIILSIIQLIIVHKQDDNIKIKKRYFILYIINFILLIMHITLYTIYIYNINKTSAEFISYKESISNDIIRYFEKNTEKEYFNVCKNGRCGYINQDGMETIDCKYDYTSEFFNYQIEKDVYQISVAANGSNFLFVSTNGRVINLGENPFGDIIPYYTIKRIMTLFGAKSNNIINTNTLELKEEGISIYKYENENVSMVFDYKDSKDWYDIYNITVKKKDSENIYADSILIEKNKVKLYSDQYIPFYNSSENTQGWYDKNGNRYSLKGNYKILEVRNNIMIVKNFNADNKIYFMDLTDKQNKLIATDIMICTNGYIVKLQNGKSVYLDNNLNVISGEYDYICSSKELTNNSILDYVSWYYDKE